MRARLSLVLFACGVAVAGAQAPATTAQNPPSPPTFRGGINYVRVDMYASSRDGQPITDLRRDEIELLEDGRPQQIKDFEHIQVATGAPQDIRVEPNTVEASRQMAADSRARVFVIFLDTYHTTIAGSARMREPLVRFIDRLLGPDDLVAVMTPENDPAQITFGRKTTVISNLLLREWTWGQRDRVPALNSKEDLYTRCFPPSLEGALIARWREKQTFDALADLVTVLQGVRDERKAVITVSEGWVLFAPNPNLAKEAGMPAASGPRGRAGDPAPRLSDEAAQCQADLLALAALDDQLRLREITEAANRTNVTFYPVSARGLTVFDGSIGEAAVSSLQRDASSLRARQESMRALALDTDGTAILNTNEIDRGLARIVADVSSYYLLGYESTNSSLDGKFRSITVRVNRPGAQVRARKGYRSLTPDEVTSRDPGSSATTAATTAVNLPAVVVDGRALFRTRSAAWTPSAAELAASIWLVGELDAATRRDASWRNGGTAEVSVVAGNGSRVASVQVPIPPTDGRFTIRIPTATPLAPGDYAVRVRVTPQAGQALPLSDLARVVVPAQTPLGDSILWRRGPSTGTRFVATADPRFTRSDRLRLEMPTLLADGASARIVDRNGNVLQVPVATSDRRDETGAFRWVIADATLAPLAAGDYTIEVTVGNATQRTSFRIVP